MTQTRWLNSAVFEAIWRTVPMAPLSHRDFGAIWRTPAHLKGTPMNDTPIEKGFQPETYNEVRLLNRIRQLTRQMHEKGLSPAFPAAVPDKMDLRGPLPGTLRLAASLDAGWDSDSRFGVTVRTITGSPQDFSYGYYMGEEAMRVWTPDLRFQQLSLMHRQLIEELARAGTA